MHKSFLIVIVTLLSSCYVLTQNITWSRIDVDSQSVWTTNGSLVSFLKNVQSDVFTLDLPVSDSSHSQFTCTLSNVLSDSLKLKYPALLHFKGVGSNGETAVISVNQHGVFISVLTSESIYLKRLFPNEYYVKQSPSDHAFEEESIRKAPRVKNTIPKQRLARTAASTSHPMGNVLRKYRIAVACTGEYAQFHGGTKADALAAISTTIARINQIYERDLSITFELIANNDEIIFTNPSTDPFTNNSPGLLIDEVQEVITDIIGFSNYDIGHVFSTGGGGIATLGSACYTFYKAEGVTGTDSPIGDLYDVDYVAHEIGHQLGATHSFNGTAGSCANYQVSSAFEPGSGSTIMGYAGICGAHNIQNNSSPYFHIHSIEQIHDFVTTEGTCFSEINKVNSQPTVSVKITDVTIPPNTPFILESVGVDNDGDVLKYCWEETDLGTQGHPNFPTETAPLFRSFDPSIDSFRVFPHWDDILGNTQTIGEILPDVDRELNFRVTVRDEKGGVNVDNARINVSTESNGFFVSDVPTSIEALTYYTVEWQVNNTNLSPFDCEEVEIWLCKYDNSKMDFEFLDYADNTGSSSVLIPNRVGADYRIMIKARNNVFFDVNDDDFSIIESTGADYKLDFRDEIGFCESSDTLRLDIELLKEGGFNSNVELDFSGNDHINFISSATEIDSSVSVLFTFLENKPILFKSVFNNIEKNFSIDIKDSKTASTKILTEFGESLNIGDSIFWENPGSTILKASIVDFESNIDQLSIITDKSFIEIPSLNSGLYKLKVEGYKSECTLEPDSILFFVLPLVCKDFKSSDGPKYILNSFNQPVVTVNSNISVSETGMLKTARIKQIVGEHEYIGDLEFDLIYPDNSEIQLLGEECDDDVDFNFGISDDGESVNCPISLGETYAGRQRFLIDKEIEGLWTLRITDIYPTLDEGIFYQWTMELCYTGSHSNGSPSIITDEINHGSDIVTINHLKAIDDNTSDLTYVVYQGALNGSVLLNGQPIVQSETFKQSDVDNGRLTFQFSNDFQLDSFVVFAKDEEGLISDLSTVVVKKSSETGVLSQRLQARAFPSPFTDYLYVSNLNEVDFIEILNLEGRIVRRISTKSNSETIDLSDLPKGVYILKLIGDEVVDTIIIIKRN